MRQWRYNRIRYARPPGLGGGSQPRGAVLLEMVLVFSVLLSLTFGAVEFAYCFYCKNLLIGAAREGARAGVGPGASATDVSNAVNRALASTNWGTGNYTVSITDTSNHAINVATTATGSQIQISVTGTWGNLGKGFSPLQVIGTSKVVGGSVAMRKQP